MSLHLARSGIGCVSGQTPMAARARTRSEKRTRNQQVPARYSGKVLASQVRDACLREFETIVGEPWDGDQGHREVIDFLVGDLVTQDDVALAKALVAICDEPDRRPFKLQVIGDDDGRAGFRRSIRRELSKNADFVRYLRAFVTSHRSVDELREVYLERTQGERVASTQRTRSSASRSALVQVLDGGDARAQLGFPRHLTNREMAIISLLRHGSALSPVPSPATVEEVIKAEEASIKKTRQRHTGGKAARTADAPFVARDFEARAEAFDRANEHVARVVGDAVDEFRENLARLVRGHSRKRSVP